MNSVALSYTMLFDFEERIQHHIFHESVLSWLHEIYPLIAFEDSIGDFCSRPFAEALAKQRLFKERVERGKDSCFGPETAAVSARTTTDSSLLKGNRGKDEEENRLNAVSRRS